MTTYEWTQVRERAVEGFGGQYPPGQLEAQIVEAFWRDPVAVLGAIDRTAERYAQGKVNSPWHYLAKQAAQVLEAAPVARAEDTGSRERLVACAEAWMRYAGVHFDRAEEVDEYLYSPGGPLHEFADDELLRQRMLNLWAELRPKGEQAEADAQERADKTIEARGISDWTPPKGMERLLGPVSRGRDAGIGRCDDCRKDDQERVVYGLVTVCRKCAGKRDVAHGMNVPAGMT